MRMTDYIESLLYRYECVVIPEFGAFLTQRQAARIDHDTNEFYPPSKTISFNRQLKVNDGLLANHIAQTEGISYEQSLNKIYDFVENIRTSLDSHEQVSLGRIGLFYSQGEGFLFQPAGETNYLLESFGTSTIKATKIERTAKNTESILANIPVEEAEVIPDQPQAVTALDQKATSNGENSRPAFWRYAAVGVVAIGLGGFLTANYYSNQIKSHNLAAQEQAEHEIENLLQQATFTIDDPLPAVTFKVKAKRGKYHLVAGAFRNQENAEKKLKELKDEGYHAKYIGENRYGLHQVIYDSYENRQEAVKELHQILTSGKNDGAWLLVQEL